MHYPMIGLLLLGVAGIAIAQISPAVRIGKAAYGDWHSDAPGAMRKITPADLPAPLETPTTANGSKSRSEAPTRDAQDP